MTAADPVDRLLRDPLCRILEVYEPPPAVRGRSGATEHDPDRPRRLASVVSAYHAAPPGSPLLLGWARPDAGGPVTVLATGAPAGPGTAALTFPPGSRGCPYPAAKAAALLRSFPAWTAVAGVADGLLLDDDVSTGDAGIRPALTDSLLGAWYAPFAWLLVALPVPVAEVMAEAGQVAAQERDARTRGSSPEYAVRALRLQRRHRELRTGESTGLWRVRLLAGAADDAGARAVAGLLCAATDLTGLGYALSPTGATGDLDAVLGADAVASPFLAGSPLVAAVARPPMVEIPGVRSVPRPNFDVNPETGWNGDGLVLGDVQDRDGMPAGPLRLPTDSLNRHTFVCGATGGGKSQTVRHLLTQASAAGVPWLVIEPAKAEYRRMSARIPGAKVVVLRPGDPASPPVGFNPLAPAPGFPLQTHADLTGALFIAAFQAEEPFPQVLAGALTRCYERLGWNLTLGEPTHDGVTPRLPTLTDLQVAADEVVEAIGYGREITDNVRGYIGVRLSSLRMGTTGRFFEGGHHLDLHRLLATDTVLEIEDVGDDREKAFLIGAVLIQLVEHLRVRDRDRPHPGGLRHLTVIEEAHRLLRKTDQPGPAAHAVELFAALLAEVRAYGEGLIIAEQIPAKLIPDVIKNTAVKIVHRLPAQDDRDTVGATMNLSDEQSRFLVTLPPGTAAVFTDGMDHPILTRVPDGSQVELSAPAEAATAAALMGATAGACPPACAADPCTLRTMTQARQLLRREPRLVVWAELAVLGHLVGMPAPKPLPALAAAIAGSDERVLDCATRQAVDAAVDSRSAPLAETHSPTRFAAHVAAELHAQLRGDSAGCADDPYPWLARNFRWSPVLYALRDHHRAHPGSGPHPDSERWANAYGRPFEGETCAEQLDRVERWAAELRADRIAADAVVYGTSSPSTLEAAVGAGRTTPEWANALNRALTGLSAARRWPRAFLVTQPKPSQPGAEQQ